MVDVVESGSVLVVFGLLVVLCISEALVPSAADLVAALVESFMGVVALPPLQGLHTPKGLAVLGVLLVAPGVVVESRVISPLFGLVPS